MYNLTDYELQQYINDDIPFLDLTTYLQDKNDKNVSLSIFTRENIIVACSEEAKRIAELLNCKVKSFVPSQTSIKENDVILEFNGKYEDVHKAWRACQILLEYSCKMATYTHKMKEEIRSVNKKCELLSTRKTFPFAKKLCIKSIIIGGAMPHRLGLSESILIFPQHRIAYKNESELLKDIQNFKRKAPEKKIVIETEELDDAKKLMQNGADVLQVDKIEIAILEKIINYRNKNFPNVNILVAGGVNVSNVKEYASLDIQGIVSSAMYSTGMANLGSKMSILN
ncbi:Quinolinate phosphoribosyl transferase [Arcobacter nitrofigilis DSM 7299]|uniref:Quinolinate phosphoribosyl transferase n=1 Tax=Arcobacter nitrofigilis (strain ATCC 33309 / DSM 7299 / CCUG 15893 / LMG 7604 / NCTC 12251 / CI) TaxID=572480 RepID=D5V3J6_ARCNC|nr:molybdenum ABC transporter [Arcobacter nitrofigilis]ADG91707.1 Quinolinate phosphoribosyl transferase [Arcobacter nitrofigilis DSM 7299]